MFCSKCGTQLLEGAKFCQRCGAEVALGNVAGQVTKMSENNIMPENGDTKKGQQVTADSTPINEPVLQTTVLHSQTATSTNPLPKEIPKRKSRKLPIILSIVVLAVIMGIIIVCFWEGKTDYVGSVQAYEPFAVSQGLPYTCGEVFDKYIPGAEWKIREFSDMAYVDIKGVAKGTDTEVAITILVTLDSQESDFALFKPVSVTVDGEKTDTENEAVSFLLILFAAYDEGYNDFKEIMDNYVAYAENMPGETTDNTVFGNALVQLIMYNTLPDGSIANDLDGKVNSTFDRFAICDIDQDGEKELLINISSGSTAAAGQFIYRVNTSHTGLEYVWTFYTDVTFYDTGFVKEAWSHNQGLANNFWPYSIYQMKDGRYLQAGGADAWEKVYSEIDFSGNPFPDEIDLNRNGIVYFIGDENGVDYNNPVDDAEYREFEKRFFGGADELYIPWQSLELDSVKAVTGIDSSEDEYEGDTYGENDQAEGCMDDTMHTYFFDYTVNSAYLCDEYGGYVPNEGYVFLVASMTVKNTFSNNITMYDTDFQIQWDDDSEDAFDVPATYYLNAAENLGNEVFPASYDLYSGESRDGLLVFIVPAGYEDGIFSISYKETFDDNTTGDVFFVYFTAENFL